MIIWGSRNRTKDIGQGNFYCPRCRDQRAYIHKQVTRYFTLYFIPLFPVQQLGEMVECQTCKVAFDTTVLLMRGGKAKAEASGADVAAILNAVPDRLRGGEPLEYVTRDLTAAGIELDMARNTVNSAAGKPLRSCSHCGLTYAASISQCSSCGRELK